MPSKRPLCDIDNNQIRSKRVKMIKECMTKMTIVKLIDVVQEINQKKDLFKLIRNHNVTSIQELLTLKVNVHIRDSEGSTPLHLAAELGYLDIVKLLVQNGANIGAKKYLSETPLQTAVINDRYEISEYLLENGAEVNTDDILYGPLMIAVINCQVDLVKLLLFHGAAVNVHYQFEYENQTPLQTAIKNQNLKIIKALLKNGADPNYSFNSEETVPAIDQALEIGNSAIIRMLLKHGAKPVTKLLDTLDKKCLFEAVKNQDVIGVQDILKSKVDLNIRNRRGFTPLHVAVDLGYFNIVKILVKNGANLDTIDYNDERTPIYTAVFNGYYGICKYLLENGANVNPYDAHFCGPLLCAVILCRVDLVKLLLSYGALVNAYYLFNEDDHETPLQMAIKYQNLEIIKLLLENGANPNHSSEFKDRYPAIDQALETGNAEIIKMLLKSGADGATFFERAIESEDGDDIVENFEMLLKNDVEANVKHIQLGVTPLHSAIDLDDINIELVNLLIRFGADVNAKDFDLETPLHHAIDSRV